MARTAQNFQCALFSSLENLRGEEMKREIKEVIGAALHRLKSRGAAYGEVRYVTSRWERFLVKNGVLQTASQGEDGGFGLRVIHRGAWGFSSTPGEEEEALVRAADLALSVAEAASRLNREPVTLAECYPHVDTFQGVCSEDPFAVPLGEKIDLLVRATEALKSPQTVQAMGVLTSLRVDKVFATTEGAHIEQRFTETGGGITCTVAEGGEVQCRSFPTGHGGDFAQRGYEFIREMGLVEAAPRVREEALALLKAPPVPGGEWDVILEGSQMCLQVHESCGHPVELDRVYGDEISLAGGSFLTPEKRGNFRYGSPLVHIVADATIPGGLGTFGYDDEGVRATRTPIIKEGRFVDYLTSRETAARLGEASNGCMRAESWNRIPLIRMVNLNLEPGGKGAPSLEELIADTRRGLYIVTNKSWSIDDLRLHFQFGCEAAWEIRDGRLGTLYKNPVYSGITPRFWGSLDAVCGIEEWRMWGLPNCGKGIPMQTAHVGHGAAPARFRGVTVRGA